MNIIYFVFNAKLIKSYNIFNDKQKHVNIYL